MFRKQKQPQKNLSVHEKRSVSTSDIIDSFKQSLKKEALSNSSRVQTVLHVFRELHIKSERVLLIRVSL